METEIRLLDRPKGLICQEEWGENAPPQADRQADDHRRVSPEEAAGEDYPGNEVRRLCEPPFILDGNGRFMGKGAIKHPTICTQ
jgi:hypothetical protein